MLVLSVLLGLGALGSWAWELNTRLTQENSDLWQTRRDLAVVLALLTIAAAIVGAARYSREG